MPASPTIPSSIALVPASAGKVKIVHWPAERATLAVLQKAAVPRLVIVDQLSEPPLSLDCCQDWMWQTGNEREIRMRSHQLSLRALAHGRGQPRLDALGLLHVGLRSVPLPPKEQTLAALLLRDFGQPVQRDELVRAAWPEGITRANMLASRAVDDAGPGGLARTGHPGLDQERLLPAGHLTRSRSRGDRVRGRAGPEAAGRPPCGIQRSDR